MQIELVTATTSDRLRLHGMLQHPAPDQAPPTHPLSVEAAVCVHGTGSNFYSSTLFDALGERILAAGVSLLRINTRGHDAVSTSHTDTGGIRQGAAFEIVDDCRHDLTAWIDLLVSRGFKSIGLIGHSSGAVKSIYLMAESPHPAINRLVGISPPRLSHAHFLAGAKREEFLRDLTAAESAVANNRGDELLDVSFPLPYLISAQGYLDKYGLAERYNILRLLPAVQVPTLLTFGGAEVRSNVAFAGLPDEIERLPTGTAQCRVNLVAEADHFYSGARTELASQLLRWLRTN